MRHIIGIDFGTSTCAVGVHRGQEAELIPNDLGETSTPSAVAIALDGTPLVGSRAMDFLLEHPDRGVLEVKRVFGEVIVKQLGGPPILDIDGIGYEPADLAAFILRQLRADAEAFLGSRVRRAVISAPAYFDPSEFHTLEEAASRAGLDVLRSIPEPVAACMGVTARGAGETRTVVYDLGGGTFDVSVLDNTEGVVEVQSVAGDTFLGGADFDRVVVDYCARTIGNVGRGHQTRSHGLDAATGRSRASENPTFSHVIDHRVSAVHCIS
jgi:molecular chaperone DnaK (HSP70)